MAPHPVRLMGTMIAGMESRLRQRSGGMGKKGQFRAGAILTVSMCIIWWCVPWAAVHWAEQLCLDRAWALLLPAEGFLCSLMLAARGLYTESMKVCRSLEEGRTEEARYNVSMIVGRDTAALDEGGIARAAVETVAENASDGVIAPFCSWLFWVRQEVCCTRPSIPWIPWWDTKMTDTCTSAAVPPGWTTCLIWRRPG